MNKRFIVPLIAVSLIANVVLAGLLLFGPRGLFRSEASEPGGGSGTAESLTRIGTVTARDGLILSFFETDATEISVIALIEGTPVRIADDTGSFVPADEAKLGAGDLVSLNYVTIDNDQIMQSIDIVQDN
ncbi:MAG: hypothetical protein AAB701_03195 [Patescibacteria group bacterium]